MVTVSWTVDRVNRFLAAVQGSRPVLYRDETIRVLDKVRTRWLDPGSSHRLDRVLEEVARRSRTSLSMLRDSLAHHLNLIAPCQLRDCCRREGVPVGPQERTASNPWAPAHLVLVWGAGNVPASGIVVLAQILLSGSPFVFRCSARQAPLVSAFWADLVKASARLESQGIVGWCPPRDPAVLKQVFQRADVILAMGEDATLADLHRRVSAQARWIPFPNRISFAVVDESSLEKEYTSIADRLSKDVAWHDQLGCMSPQLVYIVSGRNDIIEAFGKATAAALDRMEQRWPVRPRTASEAIRVQELRARILVQDGSHVWIDPQGRWSVMLSADTRFETGCGYRNVILKRIEGVENLPAIVTPYASRLQTLGYALNPVPWDIFQHLADLGIRRFTPLGAMQQPPLFSAHDGRPRLTDILNRVEWEMDDTTPPVEE